jgi:hypothetical protein
VIDGDKPDNHGDDPDDTPPPRGGVPCSQSGKIAGNRVVIKLSSSKDGWIFFCEINIIYLQTELTDSQKIRLKYIIALNIILFH